VFSPKIIEAKIITASLHMIHTSPLDDRGKPIFKPGFYLQRHSIAQVVQANSHLDSLILPDGTMKRPYNLEEIRWIRNERAMCRVDFLYWATRYAFIEDWKGQLVRFNPNLAQKIIVDEFAAMEEEEIAIIVQILKARQEGVTTLSELLMLWLAMFTPQKNCLVGSSRPEKSTEMIQKIELCYNNQPGWLIPRLITNNSEQLGFDDQNSFIHIRHGAMMSGMGRGATVTAFHLSEVSEYLNPDQGIDASLLRAAHDSTNLLGILESTGAGKSGWWFNQWQYNKQYWPLRQSRLCPIFLPWYLLRELYPTEAWLKKTPIPKGHVFADLTIAHAKRATEYVQSGENKIVTEILGKDWVMPREQMWFWEATRRQYEHNKTLHLFYQELCADDREAFQSQNASVFDQELIYELDSHCPRPIGVYGILAPRAEVPEILQARESDIDRSQPYIDIKCKWNPTQSSHEYRLVPLLHRGSAPFDPMGKILLYERPMNNEVYGLGTDTGYGIGKDRSVIEVLRKGSAERGVGQVAEFASANVNSFSLWPFSLALGTLFSTVVNGERKQAKQVIEGAANGENVFNELKKRGWRNFHNWVRYDRKRVVEAAANRQLWYTTTWSRPLALDMFMDAVNQGWLEINSPWLVEELGDLELDEVKQRIQAAADRHDDRIMATAIVLFSMHALETKHMDRWIARQRRDGEDKNIQYARYSPGSQGNEFSDILQDAPHSYTYRVVGGGHPDAEILRPAGPTIWMPGDEGV